MNHEQSKRTILIAGIGTSPAVLTETVLTQDYMIWEASGGAYDA